VDKKSEGKRFYNFLLKKSIFIFQFVALNKSVIREHGIDSIPEEITKEDKSDSEEKGDCFNNAVNQWRSRKRRIQSRPGTPGSSSERNEVNADVVDKPNEEPPTKNIRARKAKKAEKADSSMDIPKPTTRTRRQTSDEDARMPDLGKGKKAKNTASSKADTSKNIAKGSKRVTRQNSADDAELLEEDSSVQTESGKRVKKVKSSKGETSKDIPKAKPRTRRQTADEDAMTPKAEKERQIQGEETKDMSKPAARTRRKASAEETESAAQAVKPKRGGKGKKNETTKAEATVEKPMVRTRRMTIAEDSSTLTEVKTGGALIKRAVVRISRVSIEQLESSTSAGNNARVTGAAQSRSTTPSIEEPSSSSAAAKEPNVSTATTRRRAKRLTSGEEPTSSSDVPTKKPKMSVDEEVLKNRSGASKLNSYC